MSQQTAKGPRRPQLSLGPKQPLRKTSSDSSDDKIKTTSVTIDLTKMTTKTENGNQKSQSHKNGNDAITNDAKKSQKSDTVKDDPKTSSTKSDVKGDSKTPSNEDAKKTTTTKGEAKSPSIDDAKKPAKSENVVKEDTKSPIANDKKEDKPNKSSANEKVADVANGTSKGARKDSKDAVTPAAKQETPKKSDDPTVNVRESPRQKAKEAAKDEVEKMNVSSDVANIVTPDTPDLTPSKDSPKPSPRSVKEKDASSQSKSTASPTEKPTISSADKCYIDSDTNSMEMPALLIDSDLEDSPMPGKRSAGKILKLKQGPPTTNRLRVSPFRRFNDKQVQNDSTAVNLSTVSETAEALVAATNTTPLYEDNKFGTSLRTISGRKSMREIREINFYNSRDTYRKLNESLNSSMNVTVGSVSPYSESMFAASRKRTGDDSLMNVSTESPKKARLDFSGFMGVLASPVTALRAKFSRAKIQCSTPNDNKNDSDADAPIVLVVDDVDVDANNCPAGETVSSGIETEPMDVAMDSEAGTAAGSADTETVPVDLNATTDTVVADEKIEEGLDALDDEPPIEVKEVKRSRCSVM